MEFPSDDRAPGAAERYGLTRPTAAEARAALSRVVGEERALRLWRRCCYATGLDPDRVESLRDLMRVAACMITLPGPEGVMGASLSLRIGTYQALAGSRAGGPDE
ncbi:MAG TPA: hypothetical protein VFM29_09500 [Vicinamibacteria bacterium]|nr:hypothetical protein [Vicinamibacteria bacterium]